MTLFRLLLVGLISLATVAPAAALEDPRPGPRIKNDDVMLGDRLKLGRFRSDKFTAQPDAIEILGDGITCAPGAACDVSQLRVRNSEARTALPLSLLFRDRIDARMEGVTLDDDTDDSCALKALVDKVSGSGRVVFVGQGKLVMGGACQVSLNHVAIEGTYGDDSGYPYGHRGSAIWVTDKARSPFVVGKDWNVMGLTFYYPEQTEANAVARAGPTVFPALFAPDLSKTGGVVHGRFERNLVLNAFGVFDYGQTPVGVIDIHNNRMYCVDYCLKATVGYDVINVNTNFISIGTFQTETLGQGTRALSDYTSTRGRTFAITGNGTPTKLSTQGNIGGLIGSNNFSYGYRRFVSVEAGFLQLVDLYGTSIDGTATLIAVEPGGRIANMQFTGGMVFGYRFAHTTDNVEPLVSIVNPAPDENGAPGTELNVTGMMIGFHNGSLFDIVGRNVSRVSITNNRLVRYGVSATRGRTYFGTRVMTPNASLQVSGNEFAPVPGAARTVGVQVLAAARAAIANNTFTGANIPTDIQTDRGSISLTGNASFLTNNPGSTMATGDTNTSSLATGLPNGSNLSGRRLTTFSGTPRAGDVVRAGASSATFNGGAGVFVSYAAKAGDTPDAIASGLQAAVNSNAAMSKAGLFSHAYGGTTEVYAPQSLDVRWTFDITAGSPLRKSDVDLSSTYGANVQEVGNTWDKPVSTVSLVDANGGTHRMLSTTRMLRLVNDATVAGFTVVLPPAPVDGHQITISSLGAISTLTLAGASVRGAPTSMAANASVSLTWYAPSSTWLRLQ